jgi:diacylglycerol O-acyltransferase / wax synthase
MKQLSGIDAAFLHTETATTFGHVASLIVVDPSTSRTGDVYGDVRRVFEQRLHLLEVYRRKLVADPLGLDQPYWVDDPELNLDFHLREIALPRPGDSRQLGEQIARLVARPLDRSRPLWEFYVISGLEGRRVGLLNKIHHSTIDGVSGAELLNVLLDTEPEGRRAEPPAKPWEPERQPTSLELMWRALSGLATRPQQAIHLQLRLWRTAGELAGLPALRRLAASAMPGGRELAPSEETGQRDGVPARPAPRTPWNRSVTGHRRFAFRTLSLSDAQTVKRAFGVTVNDVVMALSASALRRYLIDHDALPEDPLLAMVPVSLRIADEAGTFSNRVTGVIADLHTQVADPVERLQAIHDSMAAAKELQRAIPADMLSDITQFAPPALFAQASRLAAHVRMADRMNPPFNVTISNVPGPRQPLYLGGALMEHFYPVSVVADGLGLNLTVQSYLDNLDFGLISCRELVPDLWDLVDHLADAMDELLRTASAG